MSMNIALTGLFAANTDLGVTSDNIANAGTTGFKAARAEFGDLVNTMSINREGMGARLQRINQTFSQGSLENTGNTFDMAIAGEGFFRLDTGSQIAYTRAGSFKPDADGNIINNLGQNLTGYTVIESTPQATTEVNFTVTLDSASSAPGAFDPSDPTTYNYNTSLKVFDTLGLDHNLKTYFRYTGAADTWNVYHVLDNLPPILGTDLVFTGMTSGSTVTTGGSQSIAFTEAELGTGVGSALLAVDLSFSDITIGSSFSTITLSANGAEGGTRTVSALLDNLKIDSTPMVPRRTSEVGLGLNLSAIEQEVRPSTQVLYDLNLSSIAVAPVPGFDPADSTSYNYSTTQQVYDSSGFNHTLQTYFVKTATADEWQIYHKLDANTATPPVLAPAASSNAWTLDATASPVFSGLAPATTSLTFTTAQLGTGALPLTIDLDYGDIKLGVTSIVNNLMATNPSANPATIDASNPDNYQYASSLTVYDTLGVDHTLNLYFRKIADNNWSIYSQFEGIGGTSAERVGTVLFDSLGMPLKAIDNTGVTNPQSPFSLNILGIYFGGGAGRQNIELNFSDSTQFDSASIVNSLAQNGYTMGQLVGVEPDGTGTIVARYSNDQTQAMGQVALANFSNIQGLKRAGDNNWIASTESGLEKVGKPTEGMLGQVVAGSLESSNVDMTKQLVKMIIAQRNFQANAQMISTNNTLTQTLLNIR